MIPFIQVTGEQKRERERERERGRERIRFGGGDDTGLASFYDIPITRWRRSEEFATKTTVT